MASLTEPTVYSAAVLRVAPDVLPNLRRAVDDTLTELTPHLDRMRREALLEAPWLGDSVSEDTWRVYNENVMAKHDGPFQALIRYEQQLRGISERLAEIQRNYDEAETANTDLVRRMT